MTLITGRFKADERQTIEGYQLHFIVVHLDRAELWMSRSNEETLYGSRVLSLDPRDCRQETSVADGEVYYTFNIPLASLHTAHNTLERYIETARQAKLAEARRYVEQEPEWMTAPVELKLLNHSSLAAIYASLDVLKPLLTLSEMRPGALELAEIELAKIRKLLPPLS